MVVEQRWDTSVRELTRLAAAAAPDAVFPTSFPYPEVCFEIEPLFGDIPCYPVESGLQLQVCEVIRQSFVRATSHFPLVALTAGVFSLSVRSVRVGCIDEKERVLSASSPEELGIVSLAAHWRSATLGKLASLLVHESIHQLLFTTGVSANKGDRARNGSLGFSPWKLTHRPGWLVLQSYWSFVCQYVFLAIDPEPEVPTAFLADMDVRIRYCFESIRLFKIASPEELERVEYAYDIFRQQATRIGSPTEYREQFQALASDRRAEFNSWAQATIA